MFYQLKVLIIYSHCAVVIIFIIVYYYDDDDNFFYLTDTFDITMN